MDDYTKISFLGKGTYAKVFQVKKKSTNEVVALKRFFRNTYEDIDSSIIREISALKYLSHPNILNIFDTVITKNDCFLTMEYFGQHLKKYYTYQKEMFTVDVIKNIMFQIISGVNYIHSHDFIHRDLKPQNILVNESGSDLKIVICDFGLCQHINEYDKSLYTENVLTLWYRAPEILLGLKKYGEHVDNWSIGCIFYEIIQKKEMCNGDSDYGQLMTILQFMGTPTPPHVLCELPEFKTDFPEWVNKFDKSLEEKINDESIIKCVKGLLNMDYKKRMGCHEALNILNNNIPNTTNMLLNNNSPKEYENIYDNFVSKLPSNSTFKMRTILIDWLLEVKLEYSLTHDTFFRAIHFIDRSFGKIEMLKKENLQLLGITCILIAAKIEEDHHCYIDDMVYISDNTFSEEQVRDMEIHVLNALAFDLNQKTIIGYFNDFIYFLEKELLTKNNILAESRKYIRFYENNLDSDFKKEKNIKCILFNLFCAICNEELLKLSPQTLIFYCYKYIHERSDLIESLDQFDTSKSLLPPPEDLSYFNISKFNIDEYKMFITEFEKTYKDLTSKSGYETFLKKRIRYMLKL